MGAMTPALPSAPCPDAPTLAQSRLYRDLLAGWGRETQVITLGEAGEAQAVLRRFGPLRLALVPGGPLWADGNPRITALDGLARAVGATALLVNCSTEAESAALRAVGFLPVLSGGYEARIDLTPDEAVRRAGLKGKWRNRLVRAEAAGLRVAQMAFSEARHGWLIEAERARRRQRRYRGLPPEFAVLAGGAATVFEARHKGHVIAAMVFLRHGKAASYFIGVSGAEGRVLGAHTLLLWQAGKAFSAEGLRRLDLGPVDSESAPGLARFKLGAGAVAVRRGETCLWSPVTAPLAGLAGRVSSRAVRGFPAQTGRSCR